MTTNTVVPATAASPTIAAAQTNKDCPDHKFQINHDLLYEHEFERGAFVSAHLQRLQHGCFTDKNIHSKDTMHVTLAAVTFTFHPVNSSGSSDHRFESAIIEISAKSSGKQLKFLKYAPHMAFGRISSANLKWHFKLGASVGVTQGPAKVELTPAADYEKDVVVGTMMKIQGSTRSTLPTLTDVHSPQRIPDTKLLWTLEENTQQKAGIPREFTFVFLMERPRLANIASAKPRRIRPKSHSNVTSSIPEESSFQGNAQNIMIEQRLDIQVSCNTNDINGYIVPCDIGKLGAPGHGIIDNLKAHACKVANQLQRHEEIPRYEEKNSESKLPPLDDDYESIFKEIQFSIFVKPDIAGINIPKALFEHQPQLSVVKGEAGQKFTEMLQPEDLDEGVMIEGLYNFARLPGSFEDLMELPGTTTTTIMFSTGVDMLREYASTS